MLTQEKIDKIFAILRIVHTSHWKAPKTEEVQKEISRIGAYIFRAGREPWVAEVKITENTISYEINPELPEKMKIKAEEMKKKFEELIKK
ncbi:MAG TPA: hypothetical protein VI612_03665 [Candidatus Nanoarchaeia archaeon]|nr:hypothetical protein [Candidatus Nanoarchaeia archaeon]